MVVNESDIDDFLSHYGVQGMKWGVRNDRKASDNMSAKMSEVRRHRSTKVGSDEVNALIGLGVGYAAMTLIAVSAKAVVNYKDSGRKDAKQTGDKAFKKNKNLSKKMSVEQLHSKVVKPINPDYPAAGTQMNCRRATMAYEMRRRGYDVRATKSNFASGQSKKGLKTAVNMVTKPESVWGEKAISNRKTLVASTPKQKADLIFAELSKHPNGARGELAVAWTMGGGHSVAWEVVNNKPVVFDTQNAKTYASASSFSKFTPVVLDAAQTRLDNKPLNDEFLKRWVTDV